MLSEGKCNVKNYRGFSYRSLIKNYSSLLRELLAKEGLVKELYFEVIRKNIDNYIRFIDYLKVGWCENQDCIKIIVGLKKLDINLKDLKDVVESVVYYYTDSYVLTVDVLT